MKERQLQVNRELGEVYKEFRRHAPDEWADYCYPCDQPGKCAEYHRLLERLHVLEALDYDLSELEEAEENYETAKAAVAEHDAKLAELEASASPG